MKSIGLAVTATLLFSLPVSAQVTNNMTANSNMTTSSTAAPSAGNVTSPSSMPPSSNTTMTNETMFEVCPSVSVTIVCNNKVTSKNMSTNPCLFITSDYTSWNNSYISTISNMVEYTTHLNGCLSSSGNLCDVNCAGHCVCTNNADGTPCSGSCPTMAPTMANMTMPPTTPSPAMSSPVMTPTPKYSLSPGVTRMPGTTYPPVAGLTNGSMPMGNTTTIMAPSGSNTSSSSGPPAAAGATQAPSASKAATQPPKKKTSGTMTLTVCWTLLMTIITPLCRFIV